MFACLDQPTKLQLTHIFENQNYFTKLDMIFLPRGQQNVLEC